MKAKSTIVTLATLLLTCLSSVQAKQNDGSATKTAFETLQFPSSDGLEITADYYQAASDPQTPLILLCHQARWSRGEYRQIAPKLNAMGFNCLAIDQRSGDQVNGVPNETAKRAKSAKQKNSFVDAEPDILAAIAYARENYAKGKLILWGSSYSSALSLRIAGENPKLVDGVTAFAPGEYFGRFGKPNDWISQSARKIQAPAFITSAKNEGPLWKSIYSAIPGKEKSMFLPTTAGNHGSRALWNEFTDSKNYWTAVSKFLQQFQK